MSITSYKYFGIVAFHILLGYIFFLAPSVSFPFALIIFVIGIIWVLNSGNKNNEVLFVAAYFVGLEVFLRMVGGIPLYEFSKYVVIFFMLIGMIYNGVSKFAFPFWMNLFFLIPGLLWGIAFLENTDRIRQNIVFNISGPICLGIAALYCFNKEINLQRLNHLLLFIGLPIVSCLTYLFFFTTNIRDMVLGTDSNSRLSGGFGANQVSTILGLGFFIFFSRLLFESKKASVFILNLLITLYTIYRCFLTFSRGGLVTGLVMILVLILYLFVFTRSKAKLKLIIMFAFLSMSLIGVFIYSSFQTNGAIEKRYQNKNSVGKEKEDITTGRAEIFSNEIIMFLENPIFGVGVARGTEIRYEKTGISINSHNEVSRLLAEHGMFGVFSLLLMFFSPIFLFNKNKQHIYLFSFFLFWIFTINHAAMRIAAPAFIYALSLLKVTIEDK